jgi:ABC-type multidrug transport system fused ATPase/permease subunit
MLRNLSTLQFILLVVKQMRLRIIVVSLCHTLSYLLYCLWSLDIFENFTETIAYTMTNHIPFMELLQNHMFDLDRGLYWFTYWIIIVLASGILDVMSSYLCSVIYSYSEYFVRCTVVNHLYDSKLSTVANLNESEAENYSDLLAEGVREIIEKITHDVFPAMVFVISGIFKVFRDFGSHIGFILLALSTIFIVIQYILFSKSIRFAKSIATESSKRTSTIVESFRYIIYGKMFLAEKFFTDRVSTVHAKETQAWEMYQKCASWATLSTYIFNTLSKSLIIGGIVFFSLLPHLNIVNIALVYKCAQLISWIMYTISDKAKDMVDVIQSCIQTSISFAFFRGFQSESTTYVLPKIKKYDIMIKNLSFKRDDRVIIHNLSVNIPEGSLVAVVGKSGCGKSTLFRILNKLSDIEDSVVYIGDVDINRMTDKQIAGICTYMDQNDGLLNDSIRNNIELGRQSIKYHEIIEKTHLSGLIDRVGNNFIAGNSGKNLSGGEKRRVGIARALIDPKKILYLDEMNSGLDSQTSKQIFHDILPILKSHNVTTLVIDHYHNITDTSDMVIFLSTQGPVISTHHALMENNEEYKVSYLSSTMC